MDSVIVESVTKIFRHRPALFNWMGKERKGETVALCNVSFRVPEENVLVLLGPNGSGKTTALKLISTMLLPDQGRVLVNGADTAAEASVVRKNVGFAVASERSFFPRLSARENLEFFATLEDVDRQYRGQRIDYLLEQTGLLDATDTLVMKFSSGMYQRLGIARALIKEPTVILLDEPTRSLDPASASHFWSLVVRLRDQGAAIVLATHSFHEATAVGDSVVILQHGKIAGFDTLTGVDAEALRALYFRTTDEIDESMPLMVGATL